MRLAAFGSEVRMIANADPRVLRRSTQVLLLDHNSGQMKVRNRIYAHAEYTREVLQSFKDIGKVYYGSGAGRKIDFNKPEEAARVNQWDVKSE